MDRLEIRVAERLETFFEDVNAVEENALVEAEKGGLDTENVGEKNDKVGEEKVEGQKEKEEKEDNAAVNFVVGNARKVLESKIVGEEDNLAVDERMVEENNMNFEINVDRMVLERTIEIQNSKYF